jgi:hypothetical protein
MKNPYWLITTPESKYGIGTVSFDDAISSERAVEVYLESQDEYTRTMLSIHELSATLVTLTYENGQPVVTPVK